MNGKYGFLPSPGTTARMVGDDGWSCGGVTMWRTRGQKRRVDGWRLEWRRRAGAWSLEPGVESLIGLEAWS